MKNTKKLWLATAVILAIGFVVTSCDNGEGACTHTGGAAATCTTAQTCTKCGDVMQSALGHDESGAAATCLTDKICKRDDCGHVLTQALGHQAPGGFAATCIAVGNTGTGTCTRDGCEAEVTGTVIEALGHQGLTAAFAATCTAVGNSEASGTCTRSGCEQPEVTGTVTAALGHQGLTAAFAATCTAAGNSEASGTCTRSGCEQPEVTGTVTAALGHLAPGGFAATCIAVGNTGTGTCIRDGCEEELTGDEIEALGHDHTSSLVCKRTDCEHQYALGDTGPGGGKIFYVAETGFDLFIGNTVADTTSIKAYYLEAATTSMATGLAWASSEFTSTLIAGTGIAIGTGRKNTALILAVDVNAPAALACRNYNINSLTDWFMPSRDELSKLYDNRSYVGNFTAVWHSSSSNSSAGALHSVTFMTGNLGNRSKSSLDQVRAIRAF